MPLNILTRMKSVATIPLWSAAFIFAPALAWAQAAPSSAGGFSIPSGDISINLITKVLGAGWQNWMTGGTTTGAGSVLAAMLSTYNSAILTVVVGILVYTHAAGIADTAHKGEVDNQRHHTLWTPVRQALSLGMLAPFPGLGGISMIQAVVVYTVMASVGMADTVYSAAVLWMSQHGGQITALSTASPQDFGKTEVGQMLQTSVTADYLTNEGFTGGEFACQADSSSTTMCSVRGMTSGGYTVPFGAMGGVTLSCGAGSGSGAPTAMCDARQQGVIDAWNTITPVGTAIMSWQGANGADKAHNTAMKAPRLTVGSPRSTFRNVGNVSMHRAARSAVAIERRILALRICDPSRSSVSLTLDGRPSMQIERDIKV